MSDALDKLICCDNKKMVKLHELESNCLDLTLHNKLYECNKCKKIAIYKYTLDRDGEKDNEGVEIYMVQKGVRGRSPRENVFNHF
jgi:hypothetical protein